MKVIVQRCLDSNVSINNKINGSIDKGFVLLVGFAKDDTKNDIFKMVNKIINLRIFEDDDNKMNLNIKDVNGRILSISQFTLYAKLNGNRPSFTDAMNYNDAKNLYELFNLELENKGVLVEKGIFGEDMNVSLINNGPVTIIVDSKEL